MGSFHGSRRPEPERRSCTDATREEMSEDFLKWLKQLIEDNELEKFYHCAEWLKVAARVKALDNNECQCCKRAGRVTTAEHSASRGGKPVQMSAHHRMEVKKYPELALSIWYEDADGKRRRNIEYVCETCHNRIHHKFSRTGGHKFVNEERW
ncbi:MAG: hypothetical protein NC389_17130 [Acetatifactor muris]|nr:hypothetical protein [Acetatifactor muris]